METIKLEYQENVPKNYTGIIEFDSGNKRWYKDGLIHREDGPASEEGYFGKTWYFEGKRHRTDGPAFVRFNITKEWWIDGKQYEPRFSLKDKIFLGKEKGKYGLEWLKFMTETGIEEYPLIPGMKYELIISLGDYLKSSK